MKDNLINKITNNSLLFIAVLAIPLNIIAYLALINSVYLLPRLIPPFFGLISIILAIFKYKIEIKPKIWSFIFLLFLAGCFHLTLGLIDMASLWFILSVIYTMFISTKNEALYVFLAAFVITAFVGFLMIIKTTFIPIDYKFEACQFACVVIRILNFLMIGSLIYYILRTFFSTIRANVNEMQVKAIDLEALNVAIKKEMNEKKEIQQELIEAVILTEGKERKRLANDLHDGLGPELSAVNLYFQAYIDATDNNSKNEIGEKLQKIIESAIADVSRISHNISPHIIEQYGLIYAIEAFISQINIIETTSFNLNFEKINRFDLKKELTIYRTLTELINNTIKHSNAIVISINVSASKNLLKVNYSDNGKGFSVEEKLNSKKGMGLKNIKNRIDSLNGTIAFESKANNGMSAEILIPYIEINENGKD